MKSDKDLYTELKPEEIWKVYRNVEALFRGGGNQGSPRLYGSKGVRARDFKIFFDHRENLEMVLPDKTKGLSFADSYRTFGKFTGSWNCMVLTERNKVAQRISD